VQFVATVTFLQTPNFAPLAAADNAIVTGTKVISMKVPIKTSLVGYHVLVVVYATIAPIAPAAFVPLAVAAVLFCVGATIKSLRYPLVRPTVAVSVDIL